MWAALFFKKGFKMGPSSEVKSLNDETYLKAKKNKKLLDDKHAEAEAKAKAEAEEQKE